MSNRPMLSHSQNFEDVMLNRALKNVQVGRYIDVGAWHPQLHSVTKWFYDLGWSGVNIEPSRRCINLLTTKRPRDVNLNIAIGLENSEMPFYEIQNSGLSSLMKDSVVVGQRYGFRKSRSYDVQVWPLSRVFDEYCKDVETHFLKIDVEGLEREVLLGAELKRNRPWIILIEAVRPGTSEGCWSDWEKEITNSGYKFVWFDGLNRFYIREESEELSEHFKVPINIFDNYRHAMLQSLHSTISLKIRNIL
jgi:FkbM family methyltransferase